MDAYISNTVSILSVAVNIRLSVPITCPHFAYLWFMEQVLGLLSLEGIGARPLITYTEAQLGHMVVMAVVILGVGVLCGAKETGHSP